MSRLLKRFKCNGFDRGVAAVECALILIPLLFVIGGIIDVGYLFKRSNIALLASRAATRAEVSVMHSADEQCSTHCDSNCAGLDAGRAGACEFLSNELGAQFNPLDWLVSLNSVSVDNRLPGIRTVSVRVEVDSQSSRPCLVCFLGQFLNTGVKGESTFLLQR